MEDFTQTLGAGPLLGIAAAAIALILVLVIKFKLHAFLTLIIVSLLTALATGIPLDQIVPTLVTSFGNTLGPVALLIGLGAMLGKLIEHSGGARVLAEKLVSVFGEERAAFALGVASLMLGFPIFFDAGLVVMLPIIFAVARRLGGNNVLLYGIPAAAAFNRAIRGGLGWGMLFEREARADLDAGRLVEIRPGRHLDVPLYWQRWRISSTALEMLTAAVRTAAVDALRT
jgi:GntP family gluconate:H+ symporter